MITDSTLSIQGRSPKFTEKGNKFCKGKFFSKIERYALRAVYLS